jgi:hypothetical protein
LEPPASKEVEKGSAKAAEEEGRKRARKGTCGKEERGRTAFSVVLDTGILQACSTGELEASLNLPVCTAETGGEGASRYRVLEAAGVCEKACE